MTDIRNGCESLPAGPARYDLFEATQVLTDLLVSDWTEVDEALNQVHEAMHHINHWQGCGECAGNTS